jgi:phage recombination protein Bet
MNALATQTAGTMTAVQEDELIRVLQNSLYPGAQIASVQLVLRYCQAAGLDPMQKPVHIVPMYDSKSRSMRDVIMPGVNLYRTQASRTGKFAGMSEPEYGPMLEEVLGGVTIRYPEWCRITVEKLLDNGTVARFTAIEYWIENYAMKGGQEKSIAPNAMWLKRPRGQIAKCAEAQALRKAFPEVGSAPTAEEMEGKAMQAEIDITPAPAAKLSQDWLGAVDACTTTEEITAVWKAGVAEIVAAGNTAMHAMFKAAVATKGSELKEAAAKAAAAAQEPHAEPEEPAEPMTDAQIEAADLARTGGQP